MTETVAPMPPSADATPSAGAPDTTENVPGLDNAMLAAMAAAAAQVASRQLQPRSDPRAANRRHSDRVAPAKFRLAEMLVHAWIGFTVVICATVLTAIDRIQAETWVGAVGTALTFSTATVLYNTKKSEGSRDAA